ncbi:aspartyl-phosphate phosphatase Spo0E family protein [Calidifontibacillus erzurumensis]|uniref:Aspartyl-phosphate phosphatase Spo0E family protein n=1 Tax=Calidifontibacillus erzurumensis TaxID=2741433 RepID=A0A8J8K852_9BACI|nr:aspartyl-phosphate phosphatase Spo0E family protein [Calidifontibacillus erzurumensis]NSL51516.1 aspartyl-phosphate phosphatase Spo0E family protein [Calidifontibacillus erzurumensis]
MKATDSDIQMEQLYLLIEEKRNQMIRIGLQYGFTDEKTVVASQQLDKLIHQAILMKKLMKQD